MGFTFVNAPNSASAVDADLDRIRDNWHYLMAICANASLVIPGWQTTVQGSDKSQPDSITLKRGSKRIIVYYTWTDNAVTTIQFCYDDGVSSPGLTCYSAQPFYYDESGNPVGSTNPAVLFYDTFTGTAGDFLTVAGHTPDADGVGGGWQYSYNSTTGRCHELDASGRAIAMNDNSVERLTAFEAGTADNYTIQANINTPSGVSWTSNLRNVGILFRWSAISAFNTTGTGWMFRPMTTGVFELYRRASGSWTLIDSGGTTAENTTYGCKVVVVGNNIKCYADDVLVCETTDATSNTGEQCGIYSLGSGGAWMDDLTLTDDS